MTVPIRDLPFGAVIQGTPEFGVLSAYVRSYLASIKFEDRERDGFLRKIWRSFQVQALVDRLRPYGWSLNGDGDLIRSQVVLPDDKKAVPQKSNRESDEEYVRQTIVNTGYVVDPQTGRKLQPHERTRWVVG